MTTLSRSSASDASENASTTTPLAAEEEPRQWILQQVREVMEIAMQRVTNAKTSASDRIKWSRIAIAAGQACNAVLRDVEIDSLKQQITELKQLTLSKLSEDKDSEADEDQRD